MTSWLTAMSQPLWVAIATHPFRYVLSPLLFSCAFVFGSLSISLGIYDKQLGTLETSEFPLADLDLSRN